LRRMAAALLVVAAGLVAAPAPHAYATDINESPECQAMWNQLATPVASRMLAFVQAADQYPLLPNGRPTVGPPSYPWGPGVYLAPGGVPGYNGPYYGGAGIPGVPPNVVPGFPFPQGPAIGIPGFPFGTVAGNNVPRLSVPLVTNQIVNAAGSIGQVAPPDLIALGALRQALVANQQGFANLYQSYVGTNLTAADFNLNYAGYPMAQAVNYREVLEGLDFYVRNMCPRAVPEDNTARP